MSIPGRTPAMRLKSRWFGSAAGRSAAEQASAMAFIAWRLARRVLDNMRRAGFDIDPGPPYFAFLAEVLAFLAAIADRLAHARLAPEARAEFTPALAHHLARILQDSAQDLLGPRPASAPSYGDGFIDLGNETAQHYAEFGADPDAAPGAAFEPDFAFVRYLGSRLEPTLPEKDRRWVVEQVMAAEAPAAVAALQRAMAELHDPAPRPARRAVTTGE
jgi:hypothetical protein